MPSGKEPLEELEKIAISRFEKVRLGQGQETHASQAFHSIRGMAEFEWSWRCYVDSRSSLCLKVVIQCRFICIIEIHFAGLSP